MQSGAPSEKKFAFNSYLLILGIETPIDPGLESWRDGVKIYCGVASKMNEGKRHAQV
jgi:hypothetical protein